MKNSHKLELAFFKIAAQNDNTTPGMIGAGAGLLGGSILGAHGGTEVGKSLHAGAEHILPTPPGGGIEGLTNKSKLEQILASVAHHTKGKESIVPPGSEGWAMKALHGTGMTKAHGSKLMNILSLIAPFAGSALAGMGGMQIGKELGNSLANQ